MLFHTICVGVGCHLVVQAYVELKDHIQVLILRHVKRC